ncbi:MAG: hypothetical protein P4L84_20925 [Isosphaeraceae bacterium]|nr:hypothetical protein [Isosphaeraceae bacterium]
MEPNDQTSGCACFAAADLAVLADQRRSAGVRVIADGARAWIAWDGDGIHIVERVLSLPGSVVYERHDGLWFRRGCRLPAFDLPVDREEGVSLSRALVPAFLPPTEAGVKASRPARLCLVAEGEPRETTALRCPLRALARWAETATTAQLSRLRAVHAADEMFVVGAAPPHMGAGVRYWGSAVLSPLGLRPEPALSEASLREALGIAPRDLLVLETDGFETIPHDALRPLTRAGVRLLWEREARPQ